MKICSACKIEKPLTAFNKNCVKKDGLQTICRVCAKKYRQLHKEKIAGQQRIYMQTPEGKLARSKGGKKYCQTLKGKKAGREKSKNRRERFPEKCKTHSAVQYAVKTGKLQQSVFCESCGLPAETEGHHSDYSRPLDVIWLCKTCHTSLHKNEKGVLCLTG